MELIGAQATRDEDGTRRITRVYLVGSIEDGLAMGSDLPKSTVDVTQDDAGNYIARVTEILPPAQGQDDLAERATREPPVYSLTAGFEEEPIEAHPRINQLMEQYCGYWEDGRVVFPPTLSSGSGGLGGTGREKKNPMFGVTKYKKPSATFSIQYKSKEFPQDIIAGAGRIARPPKSPNPPPGMAWMKLPGKFVEEGGIYTVTEEYILISRYSENLYEE